MSERMAFCTQTLSELEKGTFMPSKLFLIYSVAYRCEKESLK